MRAPIVSLSIDELRRARFFNPSAAGRYGFVKAGVIVVAEFMSEANSVKITWKLADEFSFRSVALSVVNTAVSRQIYFRCPDTQQRCRSLVLTDGKFVSPNARAARGFNTYPSGGTQLRLLRKIDRLLGCDGRGPARGRNRVKLLRSIRRPVWLRLADPLKAAALDEAFARFERSEVRAINAFRRKQVRGDTVLMRALASEPVSGPRDRPAVLAEMQEEKAGRRELALAFADDFPVLSIAAITAAAMMTSNAVTVLTLNISETENYVVECHLEEPGASFVFIRPKSHAAGQTIPLHFDARCKRWSLICPVTAKRSRILYLRDGLFASASGNRLVYQSQRKRRVV